MKHWWKQLTGFLTAEEVPRWFGLSLVLIYLIGLAMVANIGIRQARIETSTHFRGSALYALELLTEHLVAAGEPILDAGGQSPRHGRILRTFADRVPVRSIRLINNGQVVAAVEPDETDVFTMHNPASGVPSSVETTALSRKGGQAPDWLIRVPVQLATGSHPVGMVEAVLVGEPVTSNGFASRAGMFSVLLVVLGALFVMYRCLREQMRGVSRIADRLQAHRDRIGEELASLRINDGAAIDGVTVAWNELVELTQRLLDTVQRNEANQELSRVLQSTTGGALAEALHAVPDGIMHLLDEGRVDYANATACRLLGWSPQDTSGWKLDAADAEGVGPKVLDLIRNSLGPDGRYEAKVEVLEAHEGSDQTGSCYRVWIIPLTRARHAGEAVVMIRDVSQQIRAERAREEFVTQVTHELRTPLTNIRAYAETLSSGMFEDPKVITECYNVITKETRRLSRLIEDILSVSQLEVGSINLAVDNVDLRALLTEGVRDVRGLAEEKGIDLQLLLPAKLETIRADRDKLAVVVNNLLGNAIKYTPGEGTVIVGCQLNGQEVLLTFKDNGIGIDQMDHARVFEKFQRGRDPVVQSETGTGIGLYTAREIVRRHGGDIDLISEKGKGSTFMVRLPHRESRATALSTGKEA